MSASGSEAEVGFRRRQGPLMTQRRHRPHIKGQLQLLPAIRIRVARWSGSPGRQRRNPRTVASTSGDAERSLQQIAEITPACSALRQQPMSTLRLVRQIAEGRADPIDKPMAVMWEK